MNGSTVQDFPIATSPQTPPPGADPVGILVFSQATGASSLVGQTFESAFMNGTTYTEADLIGYVENQVTPSQAELGAYYQFLSSFSYGADPLTTSTSTNSGPIQAYLFSNGTSAGTIDPAGLGPNPSGYTSGFGLASESKPLTSACGGAGAGFAALAAARRRGPGGRDRPTTPPDPLTWRRDHDFPSA